MTISPPERGQRRSLSCHRSEPCSCPILMCSARSRPLRWAQPSPKVPKTTTWFCNLHTPTLTIFGQPHEVILRKFFPPQDLSVLHFGHLPSFHLAQAALLSRCPLLQLHLVGWPIPCTSKGPGAQVVWPNLWPMRFSNADVGAGFVGHGIRSPLRPCSMCVKRAWGFTNEFQLLLHAIGAW